jgi:hypothetical protein
MLIAGWNYLFIKLGRKNGKMQNYEKDIPPLTGSDYSFFGIAKNFAARVQRLLSQTLKDFSNW